jgi:hypothetical protein
MFHNVLVVSSGPVSKFTGANAVGPVFKKVYDFSLMAPWSKSTTSNPVYDSKGCYSPPTDVAASPAAGKFTRAAPVLMQATPALKASLPAAFASASQVLFAFGSSWRHQHPNLYLAAMPLPRTAWNGTSDWYYLTGRDSATGAPRWTQGANLTGPATNPAELAAIPVIPVPPSDCKPGKTSYDSNCTDSTDISQHSVAFYPALGRYVLLYTSKGGVVQMRSSAQPWGPWSCSTTIFDDTSSWNAKLMHHANGATALDPISRGVRTKPYYHSAATLDLLLQDAQKDQMVSIARDQHDDLDARGSPYAPLLWPGKSDHAAKNEVTVYFNLSVWDPYAVFLMSTNLECGDSSKPPCR